MALPAERVRRDAALVRAGEGLARALALRPALALALLPLSLPTLALPVGTLALAALTALPLALGTLTLTLAPLALLALPLVLTLTVGTLPLAFTLALAFALTLGTLPLALTLPVGTPALALVPTPRAAFAEAGATRAVEVRTAGAARSGTEAGPRPEAGAARDGSDAVEAAEALAAQALQATLAAELGADQYALHDAAHHGGAGIAVLGEAAVRAGQKGRDGQGRDEKAFHERSPNMRRGRDARGPRWTGSTVVALSCIACEWLLGSHDRAGAVPR